MSFHDKTAEPAGPQESTGPQETSPEITALLQAWSAGAGGALDELMPLVFEDVRLIAHRFFRHERPDHTLQTTALVHEVYLRLMDRRTVQWHNRAQFFGALAHMIGRILVDHARRHLSAKRGGGALKMPLDTAVVGVSYPERSEDLVALDLALERLQVLDPRKHRVVQLKFFMGLTIPEIADVLGVASSTVIEDWKNAKAFLLRELDGGAAAAVERVA